VCASRRGLLLLLLSRGAVLAVLAFSVGPLAELPACAMIALTGVVRFRHVHLPTMLVLALNPPPPPPPPRYDYDELLEAIAPRPALLYTPVNDRWATFNDVNATIARAQRSWSSAPAKLTVLQPDDTSKMESAQTDALVAWLATTSRT
jgi:hypothetical protein